MDDSFRVDVTRSHDGARLSLVGELDGAGDDGDDAGRADDAGGDGPRIVIDLSESACIDSGGVELIGAAEERSVEVMSAGHPCRGVRRVLEATDLERLVEGG